jgi:hypothetical protein
MSHDHHSPLRDVTADTENTASSVVACWTVFTELLPGNALFKTVTISTICHYRKSLDTFFMLFIADCGDGMPHCYSD